MTDPFEQVLYEQVAYLADDETRAAAFARLRSEIGLRPEDILRAGAAGLRTIARAGGAIAVAQRATRMRESARRVVDDWNGELRRVLELPHDKALAALRRFPMIGKPGAQRILLLAGASDRLALESNGLRVLLRVGFGSEESSYEKTYRSVLDAVEATARPTRREAVDAYHVLRDHGKTVCKRRAPLCASCPLLRLCAHGSAGADSRTR